MDRRRFLAGVGAALGTGLGGCLGGPPGVGESPPSTTATEPPGDSSTPRSPGDSPTPRSPGDSPTPEPTDEPRSFEPPADEPDPDLPIVVENRHDVTHVVALAVTRESGETVHEATYEVEPGADREVSNLREADPDGVEAFTVAAELDDQRGSIQVETSACYGEAVVSVTDEGELSLIYSIC